MTKLDTKLTYVSVENLSVVWVQSQRPFNEKWAKDIAEDFDPDKFDPPVITKPNGVGHYHVVEGQHRVHAAKIALGPNQQIPCRIVEADDPARAAEIWLGINSGRKSTKPVQHFMIAVTAHREPEMAINTMLHKLGYRVSQAKGDHCISAVSALKSIHDRFGKTLLQAVLLVLDKTWPGDSSGFGGELLRGYAAFINEWRGINHNRLIEVISNGKSTTATPYQLLTAGRAYAEQVQISVAEGISEELRRRYNKSLPEAARLKRK